MDRPIGVFDSGVGGLTVLRELHRVLPRESTVYLGDNTRVPYGDYPEERIREYTLQCLDYLYHREGVKALVIACNTVTSAALEIAQTRYPVPVVGVIDSTAATAAETSRGRVGIIGTQQTVRSEAYVRAIKAAKPDVEVFQEPCPLLALQIEAGEFASRKTETLLDGYLHKLRMHNVDTLVLGCTHYPFVRPLVEKLMGSAVRIVENAPSTAASVVDLVEKGVLEEAAGNAPVHRMLTTGSVPAFRRVASTLWPEDLPPIERVDVGGGR